MPPALIALVLHALWVSLAGLSIMVLNAQISVWVGAGEWHPVSMLTLLEARGLDASALAPSIAHLLSDIPLAAVLLACAAISFIAASIATAVSKFES